MKVAFPTQSPGGLEAGLDAHFGHCDVFTVVDLTDEQVGNVQVLPNAGHAQGGCMVPVMVLKDAGADVLMAGGMGARPLAGFQQVGIEVFFNEGAPTVKDALNLLLSGQARRFGPAQVCGGGGQGAGGCGNH